MDIKAFGEAINSSRLVIEEGRIVIITRNGKREEFTIDSEIIGKDGFLGKTIDWKINGKKMFKDITQIKTVNGISKDKFK